MVKGRFGRDRLARVLHYSIERRALAIEARKGAERLREAERRLRMLVEGNLDGVLIVNEAGETRFANSVAVDYLGGDALPGDALGLPVGVLTEAEIEIKSPSGDPRLLEMRTTPIDWEGEPCQLVILRDVTRNRLLEEALRQSQKMEALGQLTGGIAHDFNNVLTVIQASADLLELGLGEPSGEMLEEIKEIQDSVGRASSMVRRPLGFSRHGQLQIKPVDAREVVTDATQTLTRTLTERVTVTLSCAPNAGLMRADADAVHQILLNLATNARDAMPRGGTLSISCDRAHLDAGYHATHPWIELGEYVRIAVSDTGHGMDEATQARIFEPFFTTKERGKGTGLGLAMVYGLMKQHEGMAHVYSEPDQGTIFRLYFPITSASQPDNPAGRDGSPIHDDPRPRTILVIEDEVGVRRSIVRALTAWGYRTLTASDGEEGLEILALADHGIDLVISDLVMPKLGGRQVLDSLRERGIAVPCVLMTGYSPDSIAGLLDRDVTILHKPWSLQELLDTVRDALEGSRHTGDQPGSDGG